MNTNNRTFKVFLSILLLPFILHPHLAVSADVIGSKRFVKQVAAGTGSGVDWANASNDLQAMIDLNPDTIWVAAGTYYNEDFEGNGLHFEINHPLQIFGGFVGNEPDHYDLSNRDLCANETFLKSSAHHILYIDQVNSVIIDGFTFEDGYANGTEQIDKLGGAIFNYLSVTIFSRCRFLNNSAAAAGGAIYSYGEGGMANNFFEYCTFFNNSAPQGGAIYDFGQFGQAQSAVLSTKFIENSSTTAGGVVYVDGRNGLGYFFSTLSTFYNNHSANGAVIYGAAEDGLFQIGSTLALMVDNTASGKGSISYNDPGANGRGIMSLSGCTIYDNSSNPHLLYHKNDGGIAEASVEWFMHLTAPNIELGPIFTVKIPNSTGEVVIENKSYDGLEVLLDTISPLELVKCGIPADSLIGKPYQGGILFFLDTLDQYPFDGLVAAATDQSISAAWGCSGSDITGAEGTVIGTGSQNTSDIEAECVTMGTAADTCANLVLNAFDDWFLPSKDELNEMYGKIGPGANGPNHNIGGFMNSLYWSSSEVDGNGAEALGFENGGQFYATKNISFRVRAIRAF